MKKEEPPKEPTVQDLQKQVEQLQKALAQERKDCIDALKQRDRNGMMWRIFEMACNKHGCWPTDVLGGATKENLESVSRSKSYTEA